jgi:hypothetical protein
MDTIIYVVQSIIPYIHEEDCCIIVYGAVKPGVEFA